MIYYLLKYLREDLIGKIDENVGVDEPVIPEEKLEAQNKRVASFVEDKERSKRR